MTGSSSTRRISLMSVSRILSRGHPGKQDADGGPRPFGALDLHEAPVLAHDAVHQRQAEPGALAWHLGGKKWVEDPIAEVVGDALAGIPDIDPREAVLHRGRHLHPIARFGSVARVGEQIDENLNELLAISADEQTVAAEVFAFDLAGLAAEANELHRLLDRARKLERRGRERRPRWKRLSSRVA